MSSKPNPLDSAQPGLPPQPRGNSAISPSPAECPPSYADLMQAANALRTLNDPRSSSTQSLVPSDSDRQDERRRLLLVYIHGFRGTETSFRSFPAHVHNLLVVLLSQTHIVHTKIYPRYRSKHHIGVARDDFSEWLEPHESHRTDVILLGHSMGGLLSAEVVLRPAPPSASRPLQHRIVGTVNFDVPYLGIHPGVVKAGLASVFAPGDKKLEDRWAYDQPSASQSELSLPVGPLSPPDRTDTLWTPSRQDTNYNPSFQNDVVLPMRKGWSNAWHFINKHSDDLITDTKKLVASHVEFGGAMANYSELKARYTRLRALETEDRRLRRSVLQTGNATPPRVRFVNYYTASTGKIKKSSPMGSWTGSRTSLAPSEATGTASDPSTDRQLARTPSPRISAEYGHDAVLPKPPELPASPLDNNETQTSSSPDLPPTPPPLDVSFIHDPALRQAVEQEHAQAVRAHQEATHRRAASRGRVAQPPLRSPPPPPEPPTHEQTEHLRLVAERQRMEAEIRRLRGEPDPLSAPSAPSPPPRPPSHHRSPSLSARSASPTRRKPPKDRKFCMLPPKDAQGMRDPCWERVEMRDMDAVTAHSGLFFVDERYERLVGDVAARVEAWVLGSGEGRE